MSRLPRIVIPQVAHHVTQRGNRRQRVFFEDSDYALYLDLMAQACRDNGVEVWSYCLMPNHVHLVMVPSDRNGLSRAVGETHRRYSGYINARLRVIGHLFQGRFGCVAMDEAHLIAAVRYIALNPLKASLVTQATAWQWSSAAALAAGRNDVLVNVEPVLKRIGDFMVFMGQPEDSDRSKALERGLTIGRPLMDTSALAEVERQLGVSVVPRKRGPRPAKRGDSANQESLL